ncbi:hypothetical protein AVEN_214972-1 [Araneus ventricosus]|uniref:Uncharacterized protein n=1 Tax=Araneus ventricosus TaxID=182803 RepID=A0A4Y2RXM8_ARAVE|nr:hypothetical protein AVEN_32055-1 [Araneus ventricosus]GBN79957.1 hypothetical protein AVEN_275126-1 [Araneus ventricosus]GBN80009.1 hypothetical protein AVEN_165523-1 [Araneus ventricosus]GBN80012.1 hypothetical protein AVEN_214972-1 [Araneus ventricosus]
MARRAKAQLEEKPVGLVELPPKDHNPTSIYIPVTTTTQLQTCPMNLVNFTKCNLGNCNNNSNQALFRPSKSTIENAGHHSPKFPAPFSVCAKSRSAGTFVSQRATRRRAFDLCSIRRARHKTRLKGPCLFNPHITTLLITFLRKELWDHFSACVAVIYRIPSFLLPFFLWTSD